MTEQQIPKMLGAFVEHQEAFVPLPIEDAQWVIQNTVDAILLCVMAIANRVKNILLKSLGVVSVSETKRFVAADNFVVGKVGISYLGDNFKEWFLGKTEKNIPKTTLRNYELVKSSVDGPIIAELGGETKAETMLSQFYALLEKQSKGEKGILLTNGFANIFYIRDVNGVLRAVGVDWDGDCWGVDARSIEYPSGWRGGGRVFSGNS